MYLKKFRGVFSLFIPPLDLPMPLVAGLDAINLLATPGLFQCSSCIFLVRILNFLPQVLCSQPLLKGSLSL